MMVLKTNTLTIEEVDTGNLIISRLLRSVERPKIGLLLLLINSINPKKLKSLMLKFLD